MKIIQGNNPIKMWTDGVEVEDKAMQQLVNVASMDIVTPHVAVMPDVHWGIGCTVGSVVPTIRAIIPAAVGVDLGCGMLAAKTSLRASDLPDDLKHVRSAIEAAVPHGRTNNGGRGDRGSWHDLPEVNVLVWEGFRHQWKNMIEKHPKLENCNSVNHLGTLGTGNHFIEICLDEEQFVWIMLHSGSRGIGNRIGGYFIERAKNASQHKNLPDIDLAYFEDDTDDFRDYWTAVDFAQHFANANRQLMFGAVIAALNKANLFFTLHDRAIDCHHNYVAFEKHFGQGLYITRKGAVSAKAGQLGIIPGSMGAKSFIVRGKGNPESFHSCSHGAGRRLSRTAAKKMFTLEDHAEATAGVECRKDASVIDETPGAYKDIDAVMAAQAELVEIVHTLKQVLCVKG